jgi:hypothetical protein
MSQNDILATQLFEHGRRYLARIGSLLFPKEILSSKANGRAFKFLMDSIKGCERRGNSYLYSFQS